MTKEELYSILETPFWKECTNYLNEEIAETSSELNNIDFTDNKANITAHGLQKYIRGIESIFEFVEKIKREVE